jgi:two-component system NarL family response regulator
MGIRIAVAEDQQMVRELLIALLARESGFELAGEAGTGHDAIALARAAHPDVLVLDVALPDLDGAEVARRVRAAQPQVRILALSIHSDEQYVRRMLKAGADGYVVKSGALADLVEAIRSIAQGKMYLSQAVLPHAVGRTGAPPFAREAARLGHREREVLALIAEGKHSADIAARLGITTATVEVHRRNIMHKLDLHTIAQLTKYAVREGLSRL